MPEEMIEYLTESLDLEPTGRLRVRWTTARSGTDVALRRDRPDLKDEPFAPSIPEWYNEYDPTIFDAIKERDRLLHHPYDSYDCVTEFINQAVEDEDVVAIKICLYRTGPESPIPPALIRAANKANRSRR